MRVGSISYCTDQGLSHLMLDFYKNGIVTDPLIMVHSRPNHFDWYPPDTPQIRTRGIAGPEIDAWIDRIDVALFFETPFDWTLPDRIRTAGKRTVMMPMYEWMLRNPPHEFDLMLCPSLLDLEYFSTWDRDLGYLLVGYPGEGRKGFCDNATFIPVPVPQDIWKQRTTATRFLHNAGNVGYRHHKGTVELLKAVQYVKSPFSLTVRAQDLLAMKKARDESGFVEDSRVEFQLGNIDYKDLWDGHDVLIAPEKLNGLSLPLAEGRAAGMLVMTTDRFPMNRWLPPEGLIPVNHYERACVSDNYLEFDEAIVDPRTIAAEIDRWYGRDISEYSLSAVEWTKRMSWEVLGPKYWEALSWLPLSKRGRPPGRNGWRFQT